MKISKRKERQTHRSFSIGFVLFSFATFVLPSCAARRLTLEVSQEGAAISSVSAATGEVVSEIGKGTATLEGDQLGGNAILLSLEGHESMLLYLLSGADDEKLKVTLQEKGARDDDSLEALRLQLEIARKTAQVSQEKLKEQRQYFEKIIEPLSMTQHYLTLQSPADAERMLKEYEQLGKEEFQPAYALVIQAKVLLSLGRTEDARVKVENALKLDPNLLAARRLLEALNAR